ncbi:hypothetical protein AB1Y20_007181 [Prymnesium parvum]|uniref:Uncharacterized protein n=1 Tax=Prymnesium parvum TaxID=97485 RepID=A0AB34IWN3_PRYPA
MAIGVSLPSLAPPPPPAAYSSAPAEAAGSARNSRSGSIPNLQEAYLPDITAASLAPPLAPEAAAPRGSREMRHSASAAPSIRRGGGASHMGVSQPKPLRPLDGVVAKRLSQSEAQLTPSWDPVKARLDAERLVAQPAWKAGVTKSMRRVVAASASHGALVRPSVVIAQAAREREQELRNKRRGGLGNSSSGCKPEGWGGGANGTSAYKLDIIDQIAGKLHDEELIAQQLDQSIKSVKDTILMTEDKRLDDAKKAMERQVQVQLKIIRERTTEMTLRANEARTDNFRQRDAINKLRLEKRAHNHHLKGIKERMAFLDKEVPTLLEKCQAAIFEGEKTQAKVMQVHQEAVAQKAQQTELIAESERNIRMVAKTTQQIIEQMHEEQQAIEREAYTLAKQQRTAEKMATLKLGYLQWKSEWWEREFDQLHRTTGLRLTFRPGENSGSEELMRKFVTLEQESDSLVSYLQTNDALVDSLEQELKACTAEKERRYAVREAKAAELAESALAAMEQQAAELEEKSDELEETLKSCFPTAAQALTHLGSVSDYHAQILETAAVLLQHRPPGLKKKPSTRHIAKPPPSPGAAAAPPRAASPPAGEAEAPAADEAAAAEEDGEGAEEGEEGEESEHEQSGDGELHEKSAKPEVSVRIQESDAAPPRSKPKLVRLASDAPSALLGGTASELDKAIGSRKVHLLDGALQILKHEMDQLWAAAKRLVEVARAEGDAEAVSELIHHWVRAAPSAEVQSVQSMFKTLQLEAEAKKREEQMREEEQHAPGAIEKSRRRKVETNNPSPALAMVNRVPW